MMRGNDGDAAAVKVLGSLLKNQMRHSGRRMTQQSQPRVLLTLNKQGVRKVRPSHDDAVRSVYVCIVPALEGEKKEDGMLPLPNQGGIPLPSRLTIGHEMLSSHITAGW